MFLELKISELYFAEKEWIDGQLKDREITLDFMACFGFMPTGKRWRWLLDYTYGRL